MRKKQLLISKYDIVNNINIKYSFQTGLGIIVQKDFTLYEFIRLLWHYYSQPNNGFFQRQMQLVFSLFLNHADFLASDTAVFYEDSIVYSDDTMMLDILHFIKERSADVTLELLSREFSYDRTYLSHRIKQATGKNFSQLVMEARLEKAKTLLLYSSFSVEEIGTLSIWNQEVYQQALELDADTFIVMLGTNDSHEDTFDEQAFSADYEAIIDSLQEAHPDAAFYLMTSPCSYNNDLADEGLLHGQIYETINSVGEKKGIPVIDLHTYTHDHPEWFRDQLHPNDVGYAVLSAYIYDQIKGELEE